MTRKQNGSPGTRSSFGKPSERTPGGRTSDSKPPRAPRTESPKNEPRTNRASHGRDRHRGDPDLVTLWGFHPVREVLRSERRTIVRLLATDAAVGRLAAEIAARELQPVIVSNDDLAARLPRDAVHQGLLIEARPLAALDLDDLPEQGLVLVLDQVTDPHNVGAILRTAAAFGAAALITTERHAPDLTGVLGKAASGALEHVPIITIVNLARALEALGDRGYTRIGLDSEGAVPLQTVEVAKATALVLGAEGKGLRRLTRENCDVIAKLDFPGPIKSLNVSNACAAALTMLQLRAAADPAA
ncbi:TrmH family RNA methyltransferase [Lichenifustis flavocetrariae]|uniref:TrmH family RNA methyltransferase n=1 Tax=Lichenifustis flavocetrariae TaxID=2949735 RepID=UPI0024A62A3B|nr:RNA methyltransferase [Lichenifustis flavocetrariae]